MRRPLALLLLALVAAGCDGGGHPATTAPASTAPISSGLELPAEADTASITSFHAALLEREVGVDRATADRVAALIAARFDAARAEIDARIEATLPVDEVAVSAVLARHQRALDGEIAALLTPAQRARFAELGGRLEPN
jgi:hypothetical protein